MVRVLYSFPYRIGAGRICHTAWQQVAGTAHQGAEIVVSTGSIKRPFAPEVAVRTTLSYGPVRLPVRFFNGVQFCRFHDGLTASWLQRYHSTIDVVHGWPLASLQTFRVASKYAIPCMLERQNAHTAFAYEAVAKENRRLGITLPVGHDHQFNAPSFARQEQEYEAADYLLCPSEFVKQTFLDRGFPQQKLVRHQYGFEEATFSPLADRGQDPTGLTMLYAGVCEPRKGLHHALEAWLASTASEQGRFLICGEFVPGYRAALAPMLAHPSLQVLGHRDDLPALMRQSDVFVLSSVEEGSALVTYEARGSGCVLLVSDATGAICEHNHDSLVHHAGDAGTLSSHITLLDRDRALLSRLRNASLATRDQLTWSAAGARLAGLYRTVARNTLSAESSVLT